MIKYVTQTWQFDKEMYARVAPDIHFFVKFGKLGSHIFTSLKRTLVPLPVSTKFGFINWFLRWFFCWYRVALVKRCISHVELYVQLKAMTAGRPSVFNTSNLLCRLISLNCEKNSECVSNVRKQLLITYRWSRGFKFERCWKSPDH